MAKGQHLSRTQRGIVNRYYEHLDTITLSKLSELVSDLALAEPGAKSDRLWKRVETALGKTAASDDRVGTILKSKDVKGLAQLVSDLASGRVGMAERRPPGAPRA